MSNLEERAGKVLDEIYEMMDIVIKPKDKESWKQESLERLSKLSPEKSEDWIKTMQGLSNMQKTARRYEL